jgi:hypothetical protein
MSLILEKDMREAIFSLLCYGPATHTLHRARHKGGTPSHRRAAPPQAGAARYRSTPPSHAPMPHAIRATPCHAPACPRHAPTSSTRSPPARPPHTAYRASPRPIRFFLRRDGLRRAAPRSVNVFPISDFPLRFAPQRPAGARCDASRYP